MLALFLFLAAALPASPAPPSPAHYYAQALDTMNALPQPSYVNYTIDMRSQGAEIGTECQHTKNSGPDGTTAFVVGWEKDLSHHLIVDARYRLGGDAAQIREKDGTYCGTGIALFKPEWASVHDWVRYGLFGQPAAPVATPKPGAAASPATSIPTIASVTAIAPGAYDIYDMGAHVCPNGSAGHMLHLIAHRNPDEHPLTDVIIDTQSMRFCMMQFTLMSATIAGSGAKGDTVLDFGDNGGYWSITHERAVLSLRLLGISLKSLIIDFTFHGMTYPTAAFTSSN